MQVNASQRAATEAANSAAPTSGSTQDVFLKLLVAQLKSQSPLDPVDPNQFVGQLTQFNTLDQVMQIRELLQQSAAANPQAKSSSQGGS